MAKRKRKQHKTGAGATLGGGIAAGAATFLASQAVKTVVKEVVEAGTDRFLFRRGRTKSKGPDVGLLVLRMLAEAPAGEPVTVVRLVQTLGLHLLDVADAVRGLQRLRLAKYSDGHRAVRLTSQGREALEALAGPGEANAAADDGPGADDQPALDAADSGDARNDAADSSRGARDDGADQPEEDANDPSTAD